MLLIPMTPLCWAVAVVLQVSSYCVFMRCRNQQICQMSAELTIYSKVPGCTDTWPAGHAAAAAAVQGFLGCKHFSATNKLLQESGLPPIDWQIDNV
jgi:hypothetical protein